MSTTLALASNKPRKASSSGFDAPIGIMVMATPRMAAKNIRWSRLGVSDATAETGLAGTSVRTTWVSGDSLTAGWAACTRCAASVAYRSRRAAAVAGPRDRRGGACSPWSVR
jgi:hypothetical protein